MISAATAGHGFFSLFSFQSIVPALLFCLLLASRLLYHRSPKWLWLGAPTVVLTVGFIGFIAVGTRWTNQQFQIVGDSEQSYSLATRTVANTKVNITVHPCDSTSVDYCFGSLYTRRGSNGAIEIWETGPSATDIYYGVVVARTDRKHLYIVSVEQSNQPGTEAYAQIHEQFETELLNGGIIKG